MKKVILILATAVIHSTTVTAMGDTLFDIDSVVVNCKFYYNDSLVKTVTDTGYNLRYEVDNQHIADFRTITFVKKLKINI